MNKNRTNIPAKAGTTAATADTHLQQLKNI
jgi:hypothetical protein